MRRSVLNSHAHMLAGEAELLSTIYLESGCQKCFVLSRLCACAGEAENLLITMAEGCRQAGKNSIKSGGAALTARKLGKVC